MSGNGTIKRRGFIALLAGLLGIPAVLPRGRFLCHSAAFGRVPASDQPDTDQPETVWEVSYRFQKLPDVDKIIDSVGKTYEFPLYADGGEWRELVSEDLGEGKP